MLLFIACLFLSTQTFEAIWEKIRDNYKNKIFKYRNSSEQKHNNVKLLENDLLSVEAYWEALNCRLLFSS